MNLRLQRTEFTEVATHGELYIVDEGKPSMVTLELADHDGKPGSCIPQGTYPIVCVPSPKFELSADPWVRKYASQMPRLINIPDRSGILIHFGNTPHDTDGCILVGKERILDSITESRKAFTELWERLFSYNLSGISITIQGGFKLPTITSVLDASDL